ncbi:hypothetical protein OG394_23365 [Kribbella sp. NBC_01245]|uniref:hypothetical protein n=1 Tax=Kribbella sp. NBC_01245 TaxID=2903578 RepID=UPI002E2A20F4|nr:hypothetical protein [Kribbella sp. NBC_01245]
MESRLVPWVLFLALFWLLLAGIDVPALAIAKYVLYFGCAVALPGVLLLRALWRSTGNWAEDLALGATVGLTFELAGWALFTALGLGSWLIVWPLLLLLCFAAIPPLQRYWRIAEPDPLPLVWHWVVAFSAGFACTVIAAATMGPNAVPPAGDTYYQDLLFHLSMVHELIRQVPPETPQVAGVPLNYHWLPNAHLAAAVDITQLPPELVLFRLWMLPIVTVGIVTFAALARLVSRVWWTGLLAALMTAVSANFDIWSGRSGISTSAFEFLSPSQTFGVVVGTAAAVMFLVVLFEPGVPKRTWILLTALAILGGGSKPTTLPILIGGTGLLGLFVLIKLRRLPARALLASGVILFAAIFTMLTVAGSTGGSKLQLFAIVRSTAGYVTLTGDQTMAATGGWILDALSSSDGTTVLAGWVLVICLFLSQLALLAGLGVLATRRTRQDPVAWWLAGSMIAGWLGMLLLDHPASSQGYFLRSLVPFAAAGAGLLMTEALQGRTRREIGGLVGVAITIGLALTLLPRLVAPDPSMDRDKQIAAVALPELAFIALVLMVISAWLILGARVRGLRGLGPALVVLTLLVGSWQGAVSYGLHLFGTYPAAATPVSESEKLDPAEKESLIWLEHNTGPADVVLTNTACRPARRQPPGCDARGYLVSGLGGRRTFLEGWAYTEQALKQHGMDGKRYNLQPTPWPERLDLTASVYAAPTRALLDRLYEYGVRWIYADSLAGPISADLANLARPRFVTGPITIYELPPPA